MEHNLQLKLIFLFPYTELALSIKGRVNPATISKPEFCILFTILNMNMYPIITNINN